MFCVRDDGRLGAGFSPVGPKSSLREWQARRPTHTPFWPVPDSIFGTSQLTGFNADSHLFTLLPSLAPCRIMLAASCLSREIRFTLTGSGYIVRMASDIAVTHHACIPRLLPEERQVLSSDHEIASRTIAYATSRRTAMSCSSAISPERYSAISRGETAASFKRCSTTVEVSPNRAAISSAGRPSFCNLAKASN